MVKAGPCQRNAWLGSAGWKQTSEHLKGGCRVRKSKHRFVTDPLDRRPDPSEGFVHQLLEAPKHRYCRRISIDIRYRAEARQIDERDGRDRGLKAVDSMFVLMADCGGVGGAGIAAPATVSCEPMRSKLLFLEQNFGWFRFL